MTRILVVDDSHAPREIICEALRKYNITVLEAKNGVEAQAQLKAHRFDLVITDLIMPEMNGYELCRWIRDKYAIPNIPIIICSTKKEDFDIDWGKRQGADAYVIKPFDNMDLLKTVKFLLKRHRLAKNTD